jgi:hypothetical protein
MKSQTKSPKLRTNSKKIRWTIYTTTSSPLAKRSSKITNICGIPSSKLLQHSRIYRKRQLWRDSKKMMNPRQWSKGMNLKKIKTKSKKNSKKKIMEERMYINQ